MIKKRIMQVIIAAGAMTILGSMPVMAAQWKQDTTGWWYQKDDGSYPSGAWAQIGGLWYHFNGTGYMDANAWIGNYYVGADGAMLVNTSTPDGYQVGADGAWIQSAGGTTTTSGQVSINLDAEKYEYYTDAQLNQEFNCFKTGSETYYYDGKANQDFSLGVMDDKVDPSTTIVVYRNTDYTVLYERANRVFTGKSAVTYGDLKVLGFGLEVGELISIYRPEDLWIPYEATVSSGPSFEGAGDSDVIYNLVTDPYDYTAAENYLMNKVLKPDVFVFFAK